MFLRHRFHFITQAALSVSCVLDRWRVTLIYSMLLEVFGLIPYTKCPAGLCRTWPDGSQGKIWYKSIGKWILCFNVSINSSLIQTAFHNALEPRHFRNSTFVYIFLLWSAHWMTVRPLTLKCSQGTAFSPWRRLSVWTLPHKQLSDSVSLLLG